MFLISMKIKKYSYRTQWVILLSAGKVVLLNFVDNVANLYEIGKTVVNQLPLLV